MPFRFVRHLTPLRQPGMGRNYPPAFSEPRKVMRLYGGT